MGGNEFPLRRDAKKSRPYEHASGDEILVFGPESLRILGTTCRENVITSRQNP